MDGLLADRFHVRPGEETFYSETVLRMPHDYICYGPPPDAPPVGPLPALEAGYVTFGCFNNPAKFAPGTLDAWAEILRRVGNARLLLKYGGLDRPERVAALRQEFARRGAPSERILFEGWSDNLALLARYGSVDLAFDTQPYSGGLTTCEALWMGVPVITRPGATFASRHATSHVTNAGFGEFVAEDWEGYVELAVTWANRLDELGRVRSQMRERVSRSPLCDGPGFAGDMLGLLRTAWEARVASG
jgi:predicted O-linked N-acetylglucosamine transferase (SPINDLY family)